MKRDISQKYKGYHTFPRSFFLLLRDKIITIEEFILLIASFSLAVWDDKKRNYQQVDMTQTEIEQYLGRCEGFVSKYKKKLIELKLWEVTSEKHIVIPFAELGKFSVVKNIVQQNKGIADIQKYIANKQKPFENKQNQLAYSQPLPYKRSNTTEHNLFAKQQNDSSKSDLISSKGCLGLSKNNNHNNSFTATDEELANECITEDRMEKDPTPKICTTR